MLDRWTHGYQPTKLLLVQNSLYHIYTALEDHPIPWLRDKAATAKTASALLHGADSKKLELVLLDTVLFDSLCGTF